MLKTQPAKESQSVSHSPTPNRPGAAIYPTALQTLAKDLTFTQSVVITSLPRGGLQIAQGVLSSELLIKTYGKEIEAEDRLTWRAILDGAAITAEAAWGNELADSLFYRNYLQQNQIAYAAAAPIKTPVLPGYDGAVHVYRTAEQGPFTPDDLKQLTAFASRIEENLASARASRTGPATERPRWSRRSEVRQFIFDANLRQIFPTQGDGGLDQRVRQQIEQHARYRLDNLNGEAYQADRLQVPDSRGDLWTFRAVIYQNYPALSNGPVVFFCLQPDCAEWGAVRGTDFQADPELARLIPALQFMQEQFHRGPTLNEIARTAHLSPFHFHRRFTELLGLTPKHYMLDCQITQAKQHLFGRQKELADIAKECGFAHQSHFTSRFKQATGLTPTRWRRLVQDWDKNAG